MNISDSPQNDPPAPAPSASSPPAAQPGAPAPADAQPATDICRKLTIIGWVLFFVTCAVAFVPFAGFLLAAAGIISCAGIAIYVMVKKGGARGVALLLVALLLGIPMCFIGSCVGTAVGVVGGAVGTMTTVVGAGMALDEQSRSSGYSAPTPANGTTTQAPVAVPAPPPKPEPPKIAPMGGLPAAVEEVAPEPERRNAIAPAEALPAASTVSNGSAISAPPRGGIAPAEPLPE
jgi:hypothetical protein